MPLGNARDFGHDPNEILPSTDENPWTDAPPMFQGNIRRLEDELAAENLGPEPEYLEDEGNVIVDPFEDAEVGEYLGETTNEAELAELMNYLQMMQPQYTVTPGDLVALVTSEIVTVDEARAYLASKGVIGG